MRISIVAGRSFGVNDRQNPRVVIVSEKAAAAAWPDISPLGLTIKYWDRIYTVVGIAADARINDLKLNTPIFYIPYWDYPPERPVFLVRGERVSGTADVMGSAMRQIIWSVDPEIAIPTVSSLDDQLSDSVATERFQTVILSSFGGAALLLSLLGIYGGAGLYSLATHPGVRDTRRAGIEQSSPGAAGPARCGVSGPWRDCSRPDWRGRSGSLGAERALRNERSRSAGHWVEHCGADCHGAGCGAHSSEECSFRRPHPCLTRGLIVRNVHRRLSEGATLLEAN